MTSTSPKVKKASVTKMAATKKRPAASTMRSAPAPSDSRWADCAKAAQDMRAIYDDGFQFPQWSCELLASGSLAQHACKTVVYYVDDLARVKQMVRQREPVNIGMQRCYDKKALKKHFGYSHGAYNLSTTKRLMPNIAIFCRTPCRSSTGQETALNVINIVGYSFDSVEQPDYKYFFKRGELSDGAKWVELVERMQQVWRYAFECARCHKFKYLYIADVGGGFFSRYLNENSAQTSYACLKEESLPVVQAEYAQDDIKVLPLPRIPDWAFSAEGLSRASVSLLVNAWDPWSMVGNGNKGDNSLDGYFGRCTAMALLCWPETNPFITFQKV